MPPSSGKSLAGGRRDICAIFRWILTNREKSCADGRNKTNRFFIPGYGDYSGISVTPDRSKEPEFFAGRQSPSSQDSGILLFRPATLVALTALIVFLIAYLAFSAGLFGTARETAVPPGVCGEMVVQYTNTYFAEPGTPASLVSVQADGNVYNITIRSRSENMTLYTTSDCTFLFPMAIDMRNSRAASSSPARQQQNFKRSSRPSVDLYVMAFCPYGTQAETAMVPVEKLLGSKADFRIRYIASVSGSTADTVQSLHGPREAEEDLRQACINRNYPAQFWEYVNRFDQQCYPLAQDAAAFSACSRNLTVSLNMDPEKITSCSTGPDGLAVLKADEADAGANGATASPALLINGVTYAGARTPEAFKTAICNSFDTMPSECNTTLSSTAASSSGGTC